MTPVPDNANPIEAGIRRAHEASVRSQESVPAEVDAAIRSDIARAFASRSAAGAGAGLRLAGGERDGSAPRRVRVSWGQRVAVAAALLVAATVAWIATAPGLADGERVVAHATLVRAVRAVDSIADRGEDRAVAIAHPGVQAMLASIVALPSPSVEPMAGAARFVVYDLYVDPAQPVAAWTCDLALPGRLVGIEGGDGPFSLPAAYDPRALAGGRVILASIAGGTSPSTRLRVASVTVRVEGNGEPRVERATSVGDGGAPAAARIEIVERGTPFVSAELIDRGLS